MQTILARIIYCRKRMCLVFPSEKTKEALLKNIYHCVKKYFAGIPSP